MRVGPGNLRALRHVLLPPAAWLLLGTAASAVSFDWVTVGDPGNLADTEVMIDGTTGYGSVPYAYRIAKFEVTNAQYVEFLNAVDPNGSNPNGIYNPSMGTESRGGIDFDVDGAAGAKYAAKNGRGAMPVNYVSFYDSLRFVNWLENGQGSGDTETGSYTITAQGVGDNSIQRNPGATVFLTSEDEWYKAAYFDGESYFDYPAGTDTQTVCAAPGATPNTANCSFVVQDLTDVGSYTGSPSPYGTFDQGGNVSEWNEAILGAEERGRRGGDLDFFGGGPDELAARFRDGSLAELETGSFGFRVASIVPEPSTAILVASGLTLLAARHRRWR